MSSNREQLYNRMVKLYGVDHKLSIWFKELCETYEENDWNNISLEILVAAHEKYPFQGTI